MKNTILTLALGLALAGAGCLKPENTGPKPTPGPNGNTDNSCKVIETDVALTLADSAISFKLLKVGSKLHLVYSDTVSGEGDLFHTVLNLDGTTLVAPTLVAATPNASVLPELLNTPDGLLLVWEETAAAARNAMGVYLNADLGGPIGTPSLLVSSTSEESRPTIALAPGDKVAFASMQIIGGVQAVVLNYLKKNGNVVAIDNSMPTVRLGNPAVEVTHPSMVASGSNLIVALADSTAGIKQIRTIRVDANGAVVGNSVIRAETIGDSTLPRIIAAGSKLFVSWEDTREDDTAIFAARLNSDGALDSEEWLVHQPGTGDANWPNMAWSGDRLATTYYQFRTGNPKIFLTVTDDAGNSVFPLEEDGTPDAVIALGPSSSSSRFSSIEHLSGNDYALAWLDNRDVAGKTQVYFARVSCIEQE